MSIVFEREGSAATADKSHQNLILWDCGAAVAQGTHNPLVVGSNPSGPSFLIIYILIVKFLKVQLYNVNVFHYHVAMDASIENIESKYFIDETRYNCPFCHNRGIKYSVLGIAKFNEKIDKEMFAVFVECSFCHNVSMHLLKNITMNNKLNFQLLSSGAKEFRTYCKEDYNYLTSDYSLNIRVDSKNNEYTLCDDENIIMSIPTSFFTIDERIPRKLRDLISESEKCIRNNCLTGASACIRKAIYEFLIIERAEGNSYEEKMKSLKGNYKMVDDDHIDILVSLQGIMCDQVHEASIHDSFNSQEAKAYVELLKEIFNQVYVIPKELQKQKSQISQLFGSLKRK